MNHASLKELGLGEEEIKTLTIKGKSFHFITFEKVKELFAAKLVKTNLAVDLVYDSDIFEVNKADNSIKAHNFNPNKPRGQIKMAYVILTDFSKGWGKNEVKQKTLFVSFESMEKIDASLKENCAYWKEFLALYGKDFYKKEALKIVMAHLNIKMTLPCDIFPEVEEIIAPTEEMAENLNQEADTEDETQVPSEELISDMDLPPIPENKEPEFEKKNVKKKVKKKKFN